MLTQEKKQNQIRSFSSNMKDAQASFVVQFKGLTVAQMTDLRGQLRSQKAQLRVIRNTLAKRVLNENKNMEPITSALSGPNAFVFAYGDISQTAKILSEFAEDTSILKLKTGMIDQKHLSADQIHHLATLPSLDELKVKLLRLLSTPARQMVSLMNAVPSSFLRILNVQSKNKDQQ